MFAPRLYFVGLLLTGLLVSRGGVQADQQPTPKADMRPPWERVLQGEDARRADELRRRIERYMQDDKFAAAIAAAKELLDLRKKVQGADHWETIDASWQVTTLERVAGRPAGEREQFQGIPTLRRKAQASRANSRLREHQQLREEVLGIFQKCLGDEHPYTATAYDELASALNDQARYADAERYHLKALQIRRRTLGDDHPGTATGYGNLAGCLSNQGRFAGAETEVRKGLAISRKLRGEEDRVTLIILNNLAGYLSAQGKHGEAVEGHRTVLAVRLSVLGEENLDTAVSYGNLAASLHKQGKYAEAEDTHLKAFAIFRKRLPQKHRFTATCYENLASTQDMERKYAEAEVNHRKALSIIRDLLTEDHTVTAACYDNLGLCLCAQGKYDEAEEIHGKALDIRRKLLKEDHADTALSHQNLAASLHEQGKYANAEEEFRKSLATFRKLLGEDHPYTITCYENLAACLQARGDFAGAEEYFTRAADRFQIHRVSIARFGLDRVSGTTSRSPLQSLPPLLARNGKLTQAWQRFEEDLGRGTWDELSARVKRSPEDQARLSQLQTRLEELDRFLEQGAAGKDSSPRQEEERQKLLTRRRQFQDELDKFYLHLEKTYGVSEGIAFPLGRIQAALPAGTAFLSWVDIKGRPKDKDPNGEHWVVLLRAKGAPVWEPLPGGGRDRTWTAEDSRSASSLLQAVAAPLGASRPHGRELAKRLADQRVGPIRKHLAAADGLPAVRHLVVLPSAFMDGVPVELLVNDITVSYAPSATVFTHLRGLARPKTQGLLALGDPAFDVPADKERPLPDSGALLTTVVPGSNAAQALPTPLKPNDVLLSYNETRLQKPSDLRVVPEGPDAPRFVRVEAWREGRQFETDVRPGKLGVVLADESAPQALAALRESRRKLRAGARGDYKPLPGTRVEVETLRRMFAALGQPVRVLTDSDASEQKLLELARGGELGKARYLHLATHGEFDNRLPLQSAIILSRDALPDPGKQLLEGKPLFDGRLTAAKMLQHWKLDADLVTLSACESTLGKHENGEGFMGFAQAILLSGSRSACLSLWKVDDTATALLMDRFYQNLLGQREGLKSPMGKAAALGEAKAWLQTLPRDEALKRAAALTKGVVRGKGRPAQPLLGDVPTAVADKDGTPYAHPYYWAAFVLVGDPA